MKIFKFLLCFFLNITFLTAAEAEDGEVIVTGGAGYIGLSTCRLLEDAGFTPVTIDDFSNSVMPIIKWGPIEQADIRNRNQLREIIMQHHSKAIIHLAAKIYVPESVEKPGLYHEVNVNGSKNVLEIAQELGIPVVFASTSAVYGTLESDTPVPITRQLAPESPYAENKRDTELDLQATTIPYAILRYFNVSGVDHETDNTDGHSQQLVPALVNAFKKDSVEVTVFGEDYPTRDGTCIRDYVHVVDVARANVMAVQYLMGGNPSITANIGTGTGFTVKEVLTAVARYTNMDYTINNPGRRPGDVPIVVADTIEAREQLEWEPMKSSLAEIVGSYYQG